MFAHGALHEDIAEPAGNNCTTARGVMPRPRARGRAFRAFFVPFAVAAGTTLAHMTNARARGFGHASRVKRPACVAMSLCFAACIGVALAACSSEDKPEPAPVDVDTPPLLPNNGGGDIFVD